MAAVAVRKKVVSIGHFSPSSCLPSLQIFLFVRSNQEQLLCWLYWKSEKDRTEPYELDELKRSKSLQTTTDMLSCISMLTLNIYLFIPFKRETELNELNELEYSKTPSQMSNSAHWHAFLYLHAKTCIKTFIHLSHFKSEKQTELNELDELEY